MTNQPEVWLRGTIPDVPALLQPVAHALLQSKEEIRAYTAGFPGNLLWVQPAGTASAGFHLRHIKGVLDRLFSYARQQALSATQLDYLRNEAQPNEQETVEKLVHAVDQQIDEAIGYLKTVDPATLADPRAVGRQQLPSTHLGLLFHAAEHTQRHVGQLYVTLKVVREGDLRPGASNGRV